MERFHTLTPWFAEVIQGHDHQQQATPGEFLREIAESQHAESTGQKLQGNQGQNQARHRAGATLGVDPAQDGHQDGLQQYELP